MVVVAFILLIVSGASKAVMDKVSFHYEESIFNRFKSHNWNPVYSSGNKYVIRYKILNNKVWRFLKRTVFVWTTDAWHLFQMIKQITLTVGMLLLGFYSKEWWDLTLFWVLGYVVYTTIFEVFFSKIFK